MSRQPELPQQPDDSWETLRRRLSDAQRKLDQALAASEDHSKEILHGRAVALAREVVDVDAMLEHAREIIVFALAGGKYGIDASLTAEILPVGHVTRIPRAPPFVAGVASRRGEILVLIDVAELLGARRAGISDLTKILVLERGAGGFGLLVETVVEIREVTNPDIGAAIESVPFVEGIIDGEIVLLDVASLMKEKQLL